MPFAMQYRVNASHISHDRLQDEVIVINVGSGAYYSGSGTAADIWTVISQGTSIDEIARKLASAYSVDERVVRGEVETCVAFLLERGLIETTDSLPDKAGASLPVAVRSAWKSPVFDEYTDMWELIKLDPIHEVDEVGWPVAKV